MIVNMEIYGSEALQTEAGRFVFSLTAGEHGATVVALSGELGAGKTTFAQGMARALGVEEQVTSPTFVIERVYPLSGQKFARLVHIDAYRLKGTHELPAIGWDELIADSGNLVIIEWPEMIPGALPQGALLVSFEGSGESRDITYGKKED